MKYLGGCEEATRKHKELENVWCNNHLHFEYEEGYGYLHVFETPFGYWEVCEPIKQALDKIYKIKKEG